MAQQYSLAHLTVLGCAPPEMTCIAAHAGYDFVSDGNAAAIFNRLPEMVFSVELSHFVRAKEFGYAGHAFRCLESTKSYFAANPG